MRDRNYKRTLTAVLLCVVLLLCGCQSGNKKQPNVVDEKIPPFSNEPYYVLSNNYPAFTEDEITTDAFEYYSDQDALNRCGYVMACIGVELMPTEERGAIGQVKPSGWQMAKYDFVDGKYLYNRCHLIGYQLTGENANECNLITGTRYMNVDGMLPFENMVADYIKETENHVMYRVTPVFEGDNLVASGVIMEAMSVEDNGEGILFHVYVYNNQPGVVIDYATGESFAEADENGSDVQIQPENFVLNTNTKRFHRVDCSRQDKRNE